MCARPGSAAPIAVAASTVEWLPKQRFIGVSGQRRGEVIDFELEQRERGGSRSRRGVWGGRRVWWRRGGLTDSDRRREED